MPEPSKEECVVEHQLRLGLVQMAISPEIADNRARACAGIEKAAAQGAQMIAVPEFFLIAAASRPLTKHAEPLHGPTVEHFQGLARRLKVHLILGSILERDGAGRFYNTSVVLGDDGAVLGVYRKKHLWCSEVGSTTPGGVAAAIPTRWGPIGVTLCWDLAFADQPRALAQAGARLVVNCAHWMANDRYGPLDMKSPMGRRVPNDPRVEERFVDACSAARAWENGICFAFVNAWGPSGTPETPNKRIGHSQIHAPFHGLLGMAGDCEDVLVRDLDLNVAEVAEAAYGVRAEVWAPPAL